MKNEKLRGFMWHNDVSQEKLGNAIGMSQTEVSSALRFFEQTDTELSEEEQDKIIKKLKEAN